MLILVLSATEKISIVIGGQKENGKFIVTHISDDVKISFEPCQSMTDRVKRVTSMTYFPTPFDDL